MARPLRIEYPGAWYHVMNRGRRAEKIFYDRQNCVNFVGRLWDTCKLWNLRVAAYCLMASHYHILVQPPDANSARSMRHSNDVYTQQFNRRHGCNGQLFRGRSSFLPPQNSASAANCNGRANSSVRLPPSSRYTRFSTVPATAIPADQLPKYFFRQENANQAAVTSAASSRNQTPNREPRPSHRPRASM